MKKKSLVLATLLTIVFSVSNIIPTKAAGDIKVLFNNNEISFDVPPQIINDRTMVPMRAVFEAMGYTIEWDQERQTIAAYSQLTDMFMTIVIGDTLIFHGYGTDYKENDEYIVTTSDTAAQIVNGRTLVPIRAISEASGCDVTWNSTNRTVSINTPKLIKEDTAESIKLYLVYNYPIMKVGSINYNMRYRVFKNELSELPFDYNIAIRTNDNNAILSTITYLNTLTNVQKQNIIDTFKDFEKELAEKVIQQLPTKKFWGSYAKKLADQYSYLSWTNYGDTSEYKYNKTVAGAFTWAPSLDYGSFDFNEYFQNVKTNLPYTIYDTLLDKEITIKSIEFGETTPTKGGTESDTIFVDLTIDATGSTFVNLNCYDRNNKLLDSIPMMTYKGNQEYFEQLPKDTAKIIFSED